MGVGNCSRDNRLPRYLGLVLKRGLGERGKDSTEEEEAFGMWRKGKGLSLVLRCRFDCVLLGKVWV